MESRVLARAFDDVKVSRACFGSMTFGLQNDRAAAARPVDICLERGVDFFDTANVDSIGVAETMLGKALKGPRDKVVLASKVRLAMGDGPQESGLSRAAITRAIEGSLTRLQTDYLDIYHLHAPDWGTPIEKTLETMDRLVRAGRRMVDLSLSWLPHRTAAGCIVLGASNEEQSIENLDAFERGPLSQDALAACDAVWQKLRGITPKYNR